MVSVTRLMTTEILLTGGDGGTGGRGVGRTTETFQKRQHLDRHNIIVAGIKNIS